MSLDVPVAVLAGGRATRLAPLSDHFPKAMVPINGEPFIAHQLRLLERQGIRDLVLCLGYAADQIREFVGAGDRFGLRVRYSYDGPVLLGTGGALKAAAESLGPSFFVLYGDSYLECGFEAVYGAYAASGRMGLMTVYRNRNNYDRSNVEFSGENIVSYSKQETTARMEHIDYGLGVLNQDSLGLIPSGKPYDLADLYGGLLSRGQLAGFEVAQRFYEVGSLEGIAELEKHLQASKLKGVAS